MSTAQLSVPAVASLVSPASNQLGVQPLLYVVIAAICLVLALRAMRSVLIPIGQLLQAVAAAALVALAIGAALVLLTVAFLSGR